MSKSQPFEPYRYAELPLVAVERIRELEQSLSDGEGRPVTLIAFEPEPESQAPNAR
ncbi:hypothetical protein ACTHPH_25050 [Paenibacillus pasadenensis]|uniref:Uncharacterized protein n=1 Tax=Paenibacillus pasadenensis TaxID=217090 RepID=A0A2N5N3Y9_9BACL|nr:MULTISPECIES: hypothetical protein [Paenibacillus]PLT45065.1 hypothetical protein B8V81_3496 [Paenibacillus pasadenensis]QGG55476.1 hypothetical protein GE073_07815 [Paenibacillus sp. B01]